MALPTLHSAQIDIDSNHPSGVDGLGLYYHFVCILAPSMPEYC